MNKFLLELNKCRNTLKVVNFSLVDNNKVRDCALKSLNLSSMNALRDKFEGVSFLENFYLKISGVLAVELVLKTSLINWERLDAVGYNPLVNISGKEILVITSKFGEFPSVPKNCNYPIIFVIMKEERVLWLIGFSSDYTKYSENKPKIDDFSIFEPFSNYSEFESIITKSL